MDEFSRYAIYWAPAPGALARTAAAWLGWDPQAGVAAQHDVGFAAQHDLGVPLAALTSDPRKYGFHGTIKAPFRLAKGVTQGALSAVLTGVCAAAKPVVLQGLQLQQIEGFMALTPEGDATALSALATRVVQDLDPCRASLTDAEMARRRPDRLTERQRQLLAQYGYPHVLEQFQFHLTLSNILTEPEAATLRPLAERLFLPLLPRPFVIDSLCLFGEAGGRFHLLERHALTA